MCAYTLDRWSLFLESVESLTTQTAPPLEIIVCIDHNDEMLQRALDTDLIRGEATVPISVIPNRHSGRLGSARRTAAEVARGDILVFLDDDARAEPDLLERLQAPYLDPSVVAVGGAPMPVYSRPRPVWFPHEFDSVFGCVYAGLPAKLARAPRLIGAVISFVSEAFSRVVTSIPITATTWTCVTGWHIVRGGQILFEPRASRAVRVPRPADVEKLLAPVLLREPREGRGSPEPSEKPSRHK